MSLALYRKYRPRTFAEVIGQEHVTEPLSQALRSGRLHHAYLFSGPRGCGKTSSARILARSLNCEQGPTPEPCGVCASCRSLANDGGGSIDVIEIDAASHGGVDDARDLREKAFFAPVGSRYKIYVIDEAHMVSSAGFNALLKLVEEPPDYVKFIFATTEPEKVLGTIKSRTHHYPFRLIPPAVLRPYLQQLTEAEGVQVEPAVFPLVVRAGGGSARDSLSVLDQLISGAGPDGVSYARAVALLGVTDVTLLDDMCDALAAGDGATAFATIDRVAEAGHDPRRFASDLLERFRDLIVLQQVPDAVTKGLIDGPADQLDAMAAQATRLGPATLSRSADIVHNGLVEMRGTTAPRLLLELITARMLLPGADDSAGALLQRLERMERRLTLTPDSVRGELPPAAQPGVVGAAPAETPSSDASGSPGGRSAARAAAAAASRRASTGPSTAVRAAQPAAADAKAASGTAATGGPLAETGSAPAGAADGQAASPVARSEAANSAPAAPSARSGVAAGAATGIVEPEYDDEPPWDDEPEPDFEVAGPTTPARSDAVADSGRPAEPGKRAGSGTRAEPDSPTGAGARASLGPGAASEGSAAVPTQPARRGEPAGVLPDAPEEPGAAAVNAGVPGALDVAAVREVWPEIVTAIGRQSKKVAALASGATVRDLDGDTVVLTFRFPAHAKMVAPEASVISDALYEALGGRWEVRCEVAGEGGAVAPTSGGPSAGSGPGAPARNGAGPRNEPARSTGSRAPAGTQQAVRASERPPQTRRRTEDTPPPSDDDWPEPVSPGGSGTAAPIAIKEPADEVDGWPEVRAVGGAMPASAGSGAAAVSEPGGSTDLGVSDGRPGPAGSDASTGNGATARDASEQSNSFPGGTARGSTEQSNSFPGGTARGSTEQSNSFSGGIARGSTEQPDSAGPAGSAVADEDGRAPADEIEPIGDSGGAAAASNAIGRSPANAGARADEGATAANAGRSEASVGPAAVLDGRPAANEILSREGGADVGSRAGSAAHVPAGAGPGRTAGGRGPGSGLAAARAAAAAAASVRAVGPRPAPTSTPGGNDGSAAEEAPYDPEFDGPPAKAAASGYDGFDPGDEPLDVVIDEKTARESSEQQAMRLLQEAFGAEKIGES